MAKSQTITIRVSAEERAAWDGDRARRGMDDLSQWMRSACATYITCGKNPVTVPAGPQPEYVAKMIREIRADIEALKQLKLDKTELQAILRAERHVAEIGDTEPASEA